MNNQPVSEDHRRRFVWPQLSQVEQPARAVQVGALAVLIAAQVVTHLGWLSISAASGQMVEPWPLGNGGVFFKTVIENRPPGLPVLLALLQQAVSADPIRYVSRTLKQLRERD